MKNGAGVFAVGKLQVRQHSYFLTNCKSKFHLVEKNKKTSKKVLTKRIVRCYTNEAVARKERTKNFKNKIFEKVQKSA